MEKVKTKVSLILKYIAIILVMVICCSFCVGCMSLGGGSGGAGGGANGGVGDGGGNGGAGNGGSEDDKEDGPKNPYAGAANNSISNYNDVFMGAIAVYDVDNTTEVFHDNYKNTKVNFDFLINRQFETLSTIIVNSLLYVYGPSSGTNISISINNYGSTKTLPSNSLVSSSIIYNNYDPAGLYYKDTISGGYDLKWNDQYQEIAWDEETGECIEWEERAEYDGTMKSFPWAMQITSATSISDGLKEKYSEISSNKDDKGKINIIGLTEEYKAKVKEYIENTIIGASLVSASTAARSGVLNGNRVNVVTKSNYNLFDTYKGYEEVIPQILDNAFKLIINGSSIRVGTPTDSDFWEKTLFPTLARYEFVYYEDVNDICDAEQEEYPDDFDAENFKPDPNYKPNLKEDYDPEDENNEPTSILYQIGSLRKLKEVILLPYIDPSGKYYQKSNNDTFNLTGINIAFAREPGGSDPRVNITTSVIDDAGNNHNNKQVKLSDGTYANELPGEANIKADELSKGTQKEVNGETYIFYNKRYFKYVDGKLKEYIVGGDRVDFVTSDGYIEINKVPLNFLGVKKAEGEINKLSADIFSSSSECKNFNFGNCEKTESQIKTSFSEYYFNGPLGASDQIEMHRMNVWNNLIESDSDGYTITFTKNIIRFKFDYYDSGNNPLSEAPALYLMNFSFME